MGIAEIGFYFLLENQASFFQAYGFFKIQDFEKKFVLNLDLGCHRKMYRLVPCIPILKGFFQLKVQEGCVYVTMLKIVLVLFKIYVLM